MLLLLTAAAVPATLASRDHGRGMAAARFLAARMALARIQAVAGAATVALVFDRSASGVTFRAYRDGNYNGVLSRDVRDGSDPPIDDRVRLEALFPGATIGVTPTAPSDDPIRLGGTDILSFTPAGTATSGTIYVRGRDGTQWGVRVLGATARTRVLRYVPRDDEWVEP